MRQIDVGVFIDDLTHLRPAPTLRREVPVAVTNVVVGAGLGLVLVASEDYFAALVVSGLAVLYTLVRLALSARSQRR